METLEKIDEKLSSITQFGQERYLGKCIGSWFYIIYCDGKGEFNKMYNPFFHSAVGYVKKDNSVKKKIFCGLTDPVVVMAEFILSYIIFHIVLADFVLSISLAAVWCCCVGILTWILSKYTETGKQKILKLEKFFEQM